MWKIAVALAAAAGWAGAAHAQDQDARQGPPPAWVQPTASIKTDAPDDGAASRFLLWDDQLHFGADGVTHYAESAVRVQTPQGLQGMSTISLPWDPALGTLTLHKLHILRGGEVIDVLARQKVTVIRREKNLEAQQLDGMLTAVIQPEDLRVGDVVDLAYSVTMKDAALGGHLQWVTTPANVKIDDLRLKVSADHDIFWRSAGGIEGLQPDATAQGRVLSVSMQNVQPVIPPNGAPLRFRRGRLLQFSDFKSWAEVSAVMAPHFIKASTIGPASPLQAEIARIKAASSDPKARAEAALALVQDQVRYIDLSMNDGGYVPADADTTWKRRFGDCKAKTALLLALLHGLGIEAQPALFHTRAGDGLDLRLPAPDAFNHVMVRATLGGRVYWLDGTREGDKRLDDIRTPNMSWALPLQASGATLTRMAVPPLEKPSQAIAFRLDASKGLEVPAAAHAEMVVRDDAALAMRNLINNLAPEQRDAFLRQFWTRTYSVLAPTTVAATYDPAAREERLSMDGTAAMTWDSLSNNVRFFRIGTVAVDGRTDYSRAPGPGADAPFAVGYPSYSEVRETIVLPNRGRGFRVEGTDLDQKVAGRWFVRKARIEKGVFTVEATTQSLAPEFPASEAEAAAQTFRDMAKTVVAVTAPANYRMTAAEADFYQKKTLTTARDFLRRAQAMTQRGLLAQARSDLERAVALDGKAPAQYADLAQVCALMGDFTAAREALKKGSALGKTDDLTIGRAAGFVDLAEGRFEDAAGEFAQVLAKDPNDRYAHRQRAVAYEDLGQPDKAVVDADAMLRSNPRDADARQIKVLALIQGGKGDLALAEADAGIALEPKSAAAHVQKGDALRNLRRDPEAQAEYDVALGLDRSAGGYLTRASRRLVWDHPSRLKDIEEALKLDPENEQALTDRAQEEALTGQLDKAVADANDLVAKAPDELAPRQIRALAYARKGKLDLAAADFDWMRGHAENTGAAWNAICFDEARLNVSVDKAMGDCDKAVSLAPRNAANQDSRALLLLRLGRLDQAIAAYDLALKISPRQADSLYGRGLAELAKGEAGPGKADLTAALAIRPHVDAVFAEYGMKPPGAYASSNSETK